MSLKVLLGWGDKLDSSELEPTLLKARDDVANESTLDTVWLDSDEAGFKQSNVSFSPPVRGGEMAGQPQDRRTARPGGEKAEKAYVCSFERDILMFVFVVW